MNISTEYKKEKRTLNIVRQARDARRLPTTIAQSDEQEIFIRQFVEYIRSLTHIRKVKLAAKFITCTYLTSAI